MLTGQRRSEWAQDDLEIISEGRDPRPMRRQQIITQHSNTVEAVARRFIEQYAKPSIASWKQIEQSLAKHVMPTLGRKPIGGITRETIHELLDGMDGKPGAAREVLKHMHRTGCGPSGPRPVRWIIPSGRGFNC